MQATISDIIKLMEDIAPSHLAESWDNIGIQVGKNDWPVQTIWVALDPLPEIVTAACREKVDLLITHHPLIFRPIKRLDFDTPLGTVLRQATENRIGILSAHTNLDAVAGGINDVLASRIGLSNVRVLGEEILPERVSFSISVSPEQEGRTLDILIQALSADTTLHPPGEHSGFIRKTAESVKVVGSSGEEKRIRFQATMRQKEIGHLLNELHEILPADVVDYRVSPLVPIPSGLGLGLGRIGDIEEPLDLKTFAVTVKEKLKLTHVKVAGPLDLIVSTAAVCSGSGAGLSDDFFSSGAQAYISGDFRYHDARDAEVQHRGLIDIGHFASEQIMLSVLTEQLQIRLNQSGLDVMVKTCGLEKDPFMII